MEIKKIDRQRSIDLYAKCKSLVKPQSCYDNCYNIFQYRHRLNLDFTDWKIAIGYKGKTSFMVHRHCYFIAPDGAIIDPTAYAYDMNDEFIENQEYITFFKADFDQYLKALLKDLNTSLKESAKESEKKFYDWAVNNKISLIAGPDYEEYIKRFDKEQKILPWYPQDMGL